MSHPKIPNYARANLPRDPGTSYGLNVGAGLSKTLGSKSMGVDAIYEPIWSHTWADAATDVVTASGTTIPAGGKTVENRFRFSNVKLRFGLAHLSRSAYDSTLRMRLQFGFALANTGYRLRQHDNVQDVDRTLNTRWTEWGPTFGFALQSRVVEIGYTLQVNCSPHACGFQGDDVTVSGPGGAGVIASPNSPIVFRYGRLLTHQFSIALPRR